MNIGLIDGDFVANSHNIFNLDLMQLSTFHRKKYDMITMIKDPKLIDRFSKVYYVRDYPITDYPSYISHENVSYFGKMLRNNHYLPFEIGIRLAPPDLSIYNQDVSKWNTAYRNTYNYNTKARHVRLEDYAFAKAQRRPFYGLDNDTNLVIHDYNLLAVPNYFELLSELHSPKRNLLLKYPIVIEREEDLLNLVSFKYNENTMIVFIPIPSQDLLSAIYVKQRIHLSRILKMKAVNLETPITEYPNIFIQHATNIKFAHSCGEDYRLIFKTNDREWDRLFTILNNWGSSHLSSSFLQIAFNSNSYSRYLEIKDLCAKHGLDIVL